MILLCFQFTNIEFITELEKLYSKKVDFIKKLINNNDLEKIIVTLQNNIVNRYP